MMMFPIYDQTQQQSCYYYSDFNSPCQQLSPPIASSPQVDFSLIGNDFEDEFVF